MVFVLAFVMVFPALPTDSPPLDQLRDIQQQLAALQKTMMQACQEFESQVAALAAVCQSAPTDLPKAGAAVFEVPPPAPEVEAATPTPAAPPSKVVFEATCPSPLDPEMEQATLEELNAALTAAFAQIAVRAGQC